jgi:hypothetical protein
MAAVSSMMGYGEYILVHCRCQAAGIDVGLTRFATLSTREKRIGSLNALCAPVPRQRTPGSLQYHPPAGIPRLGCARVPRAGGPERTGARAGAAPHSSPGAGHAPEAGRGEARQGGREGHAAGGRDGRQLQRPQHPRDDCLLPVKAALGKTALGLLRWAGHTSMAAAWRRLVAQPAQALALIGMVWENSMILLTAAIRHYSLLLWREKEKF